MISERGVYISMGLEPQKQEERGLLARIIAGYFGMQRMARQERPVITFVVVVTHYFLLRVVTCAMMPSTLTDCNLLVD